MSCRNLIVLTLLLALAGCGDKQHTSFNWRAADLIYSYPQSGQPEVPRHAPVILRFNSAITSTDPASHVVLTDDAGTAVSVDGRLAPDRQTLVLSPKAPLAPHTHYAVTLNQLETAVGGAALPAGGVGFTTRAAVQGPASAVSEGPFAVSRLLPDASRYPLMDFSTLRLQFTQPLDPASVRYGDTVSLTDASGALVPATLIDHGPYLTLDPDDLLTPGSPYTLSLSSSISSTLGHNLDPGDYASFLFTPADSAPRETMVQQVPVANGGARLSPLTGEPINTVPVKALLLGDDSRSQQSGDTRVQLAFVPHYPEATPVRIAKGTLLNGSSVSVNINGHVPAGFDTGAIAVRFISDANGILTANPYSSSADAPRHVTLFMDIAMSTENAKANGGLSQDLMHVQLDGISQVKNGVMVIDAVGVVELGVLGLNRPTAPCPSTWRAMRTRSIRRQPWRIPVCPDLQSWVPGNHSDKARPGDPVIVNFTKALDRDSVAQAGSVKLLADGVQQTVTASSTAPP